MKKKTHYILLIHKLETQQVSLSNTQTELQRYYRHRRTTAYDRNPFSFLCMKDCGWLKHKKPFTLFSPLHSVSLYSPMIRGSAWRWTHATNMLCRQRFANLCKKKNTFSLYNTNEEGLTYPFQLNRSHFDFFHPFLMFIMNHCSWLKKGCNPFWKWITAQSHRWFYN